MRSRGAAISNRVRNQCLRRSNRNYTSRLNDRVVSEVAVCFLDRAKRGIIAAGAFRDLAQVVLELSGIRRLNVLPSRVHVEPELVEVFVAGHTAPEKRSPLASQKSQGELGL